MQMGRNSKLTKKMTQTVAFGVTSQKEILYNAQPLVEVKSAYIQQIEFNVLYLKEFMPITPQSIGHRDLST
ncbi:hypothetical protein DLR60_15195 [Vibrio tarriae]|uniref:Uncharacterized protein n=2 Tax=Vibrionaceae TaxID=641 RepID=A0AAU8WR79_9VIBR|nr:hypothetical protein CEQ48_14555 [Vibrio tarriae]EGQ9319896.1 hypothetical protein [Vibrio cholerae]EGQ9645128.1 hypothetical protein [Vibrio cholerae]EGR1043500.1 hypothetical protein [Vibrio cholerae]EGR2392387.1 hypothetical protein [Vibrio cholerae]